MSNAAIETILAYRLTGLDDAPAKLDATSNAVSKLNQQLQAAQAGGASHSTINNLTDSLKLMTAQLEAAQDRMVQFTTVTKQLQDLRILNNTPAVDSLGPATRKEFEKVRDNASFLNDPQNYESTAQSYHQSMGGSLDDARRQVSKDKMAVEEQLNEFKARLQTVAYKDAEKKLKTEIRAFDKANPQATASEQGEYYEQRKSFYARGLSYTPGENPENRKAYQRAAEHPVKSYMRERYENLFGEEGRINAGYAVAQLGEEAAQAAELTMTGRRYTPEALDRAKYGLAPGIGSLIGSAWGWGGQLVGGGIGSVAQGVLSANSEKNESVRLASDELASALGQSGAAARGYATALTDAANKVGQPVVELAQTMTAIARLAPTLNVAGAASQQAYLQSQLGDRYAPVMSSVMRYAASAPFAMDFRSRLGTGTLTADDLNGAAGYSALQGDIGGIEDTSEAGAALGSNKQRASLNAGLNSVKEQRKGYFNQYRQWIADWQNTPIGKWDAKLNPFSFGQSLVKGLTPDLDKEQKDYEKQLADLDKNDKDKVSHDKRVQGLKDVAAAIVTSSAYAGEFGLQAGIEGAGMGRAFESGQGVAGAAPYFVQEQARLRDEKTALQTQRNAITAKGQYDTTDSQKAQTALSLAQVDTRIAEAVGRALTSSVQMFQAKISEREAVFGGASARLGIGQSEYTLGGGSALSPASNAFYAGRAANMANEARYLRDLALDKSNFLSPEQRQQYLTRSGELGMQARYALPNEQRLARLGELEGRSSERQSYIGIGRAQAGVTGDVAASLATGLGSLQEEADLRRRLTEEMQKGNLTETQREQLQKRINDSLASEVTQRKAILDTVYQTVQAGQQAASAGAGSRAGRQEFYGGTTAASFGSRQEQFSSTLAAAETAKRKYLFERGLNPNSQATQQAYAEYEALRAGAAQEQVSAFGNVEMSAEFAGRQGTLQAQLRRQSQSIYEPGSRLQTNSQIAQGIQRRMSAIQAERDRARKAGQLSQPVENRLREQEDAAREQLLSANNEMQTGWIDRLVSMSVGAPSFSSRLMPGPADVAGIAERRGLGPMSARVFGSYDRNSYRQAAALGMLPSDVGKMAFGHRPGDYGESAYQAGRAADGGPLSALPKDLTSDVPRPGTMSDPTGSKAMADATMALVALLRQGLKVNVTMTNPTTGQTASQTVNATNNYNSTAIQKGGANPNAPSRDLTGY